MERKNELLIRVYLIFFLFIVLAFVIIGKVVNTTVVEGERWRSQGQKNMKWIEAEGERGNIYDVNGNLLATSLPYFDVKVDLLPSKEDKYFNENIDGLSKKLAEHFGKTSYEWKAELTKVRNDGKRGRNSQARYYSLFDKVTKDQLELLKTFPLFNLGKYKGGLLYERKNRRERPFRELAKRTIGMDRQNAEKIGLERTFDKMLNGEVQKRLMRRLPGDIWLPVIDPSVMMQEKGNDIVTTLDMHIQDVVHSELEKVLIDKKAQKGVAILMEVETGAIRAISNLRSTGLGYYEEAFNDGIGSLSEPGSTFKLITALALMDKGVVDLDTEVQMFGGKKKFYNHWMYDSEMHGKQKGSFKEAFAISSNIGVGLAAFNYYGKNRNGWQSFYDDLKKLGVMNKTGIEIFGERSPKFKDPSVKKKDDPENWSGTTVPWMSHGYELEMTPLQVLNIYNAVANDGRLMKPYLVKEIIDGDGKTTTFKPKVLIDQIAKPQTIANAQELLLEVAESGTARKLKVEGLSFAGKTGTTKLRYWEQSESSSYNASFVGYFPAKNPKYSMMVVVFDPEGRDYYGSKVAGPVFKNVMERLSGYEGRKVFAEGQDEVPIVYASSGNRADFKKLFKYIGISYEESGKGNWIDMVPAANGASLEVEKIDKNLVPELRGKGLRDALYILEALGYEVEIEGLGKVYKQSLKAGTKSGKKEIKIYMK